jgi:hypothetical protein
MKQRIYKCYNIIADLLNCTYTEGNRNKKLNQAYEILTELVLEMENDKKK